MGFFYSLFLVYSKNIITIFTTNICEKCPSSILYRDSNPRPSVHESPPITTRPGPPPAHIAGHYIDESSLNFIVNVMFQHLANKELETC